MKTLSGPALLLCLFIQSYTSTGLCEPALISLDDRVRRSDLVIVGKLGDISEKHFSVSLAKKKGFLGRKKREEVFYDLGKISVSKVLRGKRPGKHVSFAYHNLKQESTPLLHQVVTFPKGTDGIWMLTREDIFTGFYVVKHSSDYLPLSSLQAVKEAIKRVESEAELVVYVSNQSFEITPVDIQMYVDDKLIVNQDFAVEEQRDWKAFAVKLPLGEHTLLAKSVRGGAALKRQFELKKKTWAILDFWYYPARIGGPPPRPREFSLVLRSAPIQLE